MRGSFGTWENEAVCYSDCSVVKWWGSYMRLDEATPLTPWLHYKRQIQTQIKKMCYVKQFSGEQVWSQFIELICNLDLSVMKTVWNEVCVICIDGRVGLHCQRTHVAAAIFEPQSLLKMTCFPPPTTTIKFTVRWRPSLHCDITKQGFSAMIICISISKFTENLYSKIPDMKKSYAAGWLKGL